MNRILLNTHWFPKGKVDGFQKVRNHIKMKMCKRNMPIKRTGLQRIKEQAWISLTAPNQSSATRILTIADHRGKAVLWLPAGLLGFILLLMIPPPQYGDFFSILFKLI